MNHLQHMVKLDKVKNEHGDLVSIDDPAVQEFLLSEEVQCIKQDRELFNYFFEMME